MSGTILVPLDGSPLAERVLPLALALAEQSAGALLLLHVVPEPTRPLRRADGTLLSEVEQLRSFQAGAMRYLEEIEAQLAAAALTVTRAVTVGEAGAEIARVANESHVAYLVMGTHGRTGLSRWALGSVTARVLPQTVCPVLILPARAPAAHAHERFKHIVVPLDGSAPTEQVLPLAKALCSPDGDLFLFYALPLPPVLVGGPEVVMLETEWYEATRAEAHEYLERQVAALRLEGFTVHAEIGREPAAEAILAYAKKVQADLIAMTTQARGGLSRLFLGSVTERVVQLAEVPILVGRAIESPPASLEAD